MESDNKDDSPVNDVGSSYVNPEGVYNDTSRNRKIAERVIAGITVVMVIISTVLSIVQGVNVNAMYFLVTANLAITCLISIIMSWWYHSGALDQTKWWFMLLTAIVVNMQCVTANVYVCHIPPSQPPTNTTIFTTTLMTTTASSTSKSLF